MRKIEDIKNKILQGDALSVLKTLPTESIDCVMTSPPYWALRDYGVKGQLGLEPTFQEYITKLCNIFDEIKRVLKKTGTCWVNMGDTYGGSGDKGEYKDPKYINGRNGQKTAINKTATDKCLCQIPSRFAIEMCNRGWILRNEIIWHKNNCMPSSVNDRFTVDFEKLFFFTKCKKYYFEQQFEPHRTNERRPDGIIRNREYGYDSKLNALHKKTYSLRQKRGGDKNPDFLNPEGRNKRAVWNINTRPYSEAHFAVFPEELCETPIKAGCPQFIYNKCNKIREKIVENIGMKSIQPIDGIKKAGGDNRTYSGNIETPIWKNKGLSDCGCNTGFKSGIVLDPFFGSGTTGLVARKQLKNWIGIELNPEYIKIADKRIKQIPEKLDKWSKPQTQKPL